MTSTATLPFTPNVEAVDDVITQIKDRPKKNFKMSSWAINLGSDVPYSQDGEPLVCKTALCIGGYACATSPVKNDRLAILDMMDSAWDAPGLKTFRKKNKLSVETRACRRLGIPKSMGERLFFTGSWPSNITYRINQGMLTERSAAVKLLTAIRNGKNPWAVDGITFK